MEISKMNKQQIITRIGEVQNMIINAEKPVLNDRSAEDVDDAYQDRLEYTWYIADLKDELNDLEFILTHHFPKLI